MNFLKEKLRGLRMCTNFKGYLRNIIGISSLKLTDCVRSNIISLKISGNAEQNGVPSVNLPIKIQGCGQRMGNLFRLSDRTELQNTSASPPTMPKEFNNNIIIGLARNGYWDSSRIVSYSFDGDNFMLHSSAGYGLGFDFNVSEGETYTIAFDSSISVDSGVSFYDADGLFISVTNIDDGGIVTVPNNATKLVWCVASNINVNISNVQIIKGAYTNENISEYEPYGYKIPFEMRGANLFGLSSKTYAYNPSPLRPTTPKNFNNNIIIGLSSNGYWDSNRIVSYSINDDNFSLQSSAGYGLGFDFDVTPGETYTIKYIMTGDDVDGGTNHVSWYDSNGLYISRVPINNGFVSVTVPNNAVKLVLCFVSDENTTMTISNVQLLKGSYTVETMPKYEPYLQFNIYTDKPLYGINDIVDIITVDFNAKMAMRTDRIAEIETYNGENINGEYRSSTGSLTEGAQVIYELSDPIVTDISSLQNWDAIPSLWRSTITISAKTTVQPSNIIIEYYATKPEEG